jgi:hypothetical protein
MNTEQRNASKKRWRAGNSPAALEYRERERRRVNSYKRKRRNVLLEVRREHDFRMHAQEIRRHPAPLAPGMSIVSRHALTHDLTRWTGPGMMKELRLEKEADEILRN